VLAITVRWEMETGLGWTCLTHNSAAGRPKPGWQLSQDLKKDGDTTGCLIGSVSDRIFLDWYLIGLVSDMFGI
jgi:hypothetical protein